ncbi:glycoside hydrolase 43 family protein [bacterium]
MKCQMIFPVFFLFLVMLMQAENWIPDQENGTYQNPIIFADYSDPDAIRVNEDYYMIASSFNCMPGIPVLHSKDLVNWTIIGHVYDRLPFEKYDKPVHGQGSWAPSIRYHNNQFYVYFCTPHEGLFMAKAKDPKGPWELHHVAKVEMWEDPCPLWDDDGNAYLIRSKLCGQPMIVHRMSPDGKKLLDNGIIVFDDQENQPVLEGPKFLKKDGYYYILAPAGGVPTGWQTILRSKNIYGPYETKIVLHKGNTQINGPHQGGLVDTKTGEWWFVHFQDRGTYGRIVHLQPARWEEGWPLMGVDQNEDEIGEPVYVYQKPNVVKSYPVMIPQTSDEFNSNILGLQWQWHANYCESWYSLTDHPGHLRLNAVQNLSQNGNLWFVPNLFMQKFPAPIFTVTAKLEFDADLVQEKCGLVVMGEAWAFLALEKSEKGLNLGMYTGSYHQCNDQTNLIESVPVQEKSVYLKVDVTEQTTCAFYYSLDGKEFQKIGQPFTAKKGKWIGAKVGMFCLNPNIAKSRGYMDVDWFRIE